jgi:hypothetical protein
VRHRRSSVAARVASWLLVVLPLLAACGKQAEAPPEAPTGRFAAYAVSHDARAAADTLDGLSQKAADQSALDKCRRAAKAVDACTANKGLVCKAVSFGCMEGLPLGFCHSIEEQRAAQAPAPATPEMSPATQRKGPFGAIAVGRQGNRAGTAYAHATRAGAEAAAEATCRGTGKTVVDDCASKVWFKNACGAVAAGKNDTYGTGWDKSPAGACRWALATCRKSGGVQCEATIYSCSPRNEWGSCSGKFKSIH